MRATLAKFIEDRVKEARRSLNGDVMATLDPGDRKGAVLPDGSDIGTVSVAKGRKTIRVVDEAAYREWVREHSPHNVFAPEPVEQVRPAYTKALADQAEVVDGLLVDATTGEVVPGIQQVAGEPYVSVKISDTQLDELFEALDRGELNEILTGLLQTAERPAIEGETE